MYVFDENIERLLNYYAEQCRTYAAVANLAEQNQVMQLDHFLMSRASKPTFDTAPDNDNLRQSFANVRVIMNRNEHKGSAQPDVDMERTVKNSILADRALLSGMQLHMSLQPDPYFEPYDLLPIDQTERVQEIHRLFDVGYSVLNLWVNYVRQATGWRGIGETAEQKEIETGLLAYSTSNLLEFAADFYTADVMNNSRDAALAHLVNALCSLDPLKGAGEAQLNDFAQYVTDLFEIDAPDTTPGMDPSEKPEPR